MAAAGTIREAFSPTPPMLGTGWARSRVSVALSLPSAIIPRERNLLLNPLHPDFARIRLLPPEEFSFDPRMWKG